MSDTETIPEWQKNGDRIAECLRLLDEHTGLEWEDLMSDPSGGSSGYVNLFAYPAAVVDGSPIALVVKLQPCYWDEDEYDEESDRYNWTAEVSSVDPGPWRADRDAAIQLMRDSGLADEDIAWVMETEDRQVCRIVEILHSDGRHATLIESGTYPDFVDCVRELCTRGRRSIREAIAEIGSYLDRPQNQIGSTGRDFMAGELVSRKWTTPEAIVAARR